MLIFKRIVAINILPWSVVNKHLHYRKVKLEQHPDYENKFIDISDASYSWCGVYKNKINTLLSTWKVVFYSLISMQAPSRNPTASYVNIPPHSFVYKCVLVFSHSNAYLAVW